jgi:hypothetical protein
MTQLHGQRCLALLLIVIAIACSEEPPAARFDGVSGGAGGAGGSGGTTGLGGTTGGIGGMSGSIGGAAGMIAGMGGMTGGAGGSGGSGLAGAGGMTGGAAGMSGEGGTSGEGGMGGQGGMGGEGGTLPIDPSLCMVEPIPDDVRAEYDLDAFHTRTALALGIPIVGSDEPSDESLTRACLIIADMASARDDVLQQLLEDNIYFIMIARTETTASTPEFRNSGVPDSRARGLGGLPAAVCSEENIMCDGYPEDRWAGESICVHEYAHTMQMGGYSRGIADFDTRLRAAYENILAENLYSNTYAASNRAEYFAEGVQNWYNTNIETRDGQPNGVHNHINTRTEMQEYDPMLYELLEEILPAEPMYQDCYYYEDE